MLRRDFLSGALALSLATARAGFAAPRSSPKNILDYGATPDGRTLSTGPIQRAVDDAFHAGGGTVLVPSGTFLTGRIDLRSGITLYLAPGSTLLGSTSIDDYNSSEGPYPHQHHLLFAVNADDVTIAGPGRIDAQGPAFWEASGKAPLPPQDEWRNFASRYYKPKSSGRPSPTLYCIGCRRLRIEDVHIENAPGWTINTLNCDGVTIQNITIANPVEGPNTDGIDIAGCQNVLISGCSISTGDDAICLKSDNPLGPEPLLIKNVEVTNCTLTTCCNGFKLGTNSEGGFENIRFSDSFVGNRDEVPFADRVIAGIALEVVDGGWIDGVQIAGIRMQRARAAIFLRLGNRKPPQDPARHGLRNVSIQDVQASETLLASSITGIPGSYVQDVSLSNISIANALPSRPEWVDRPVPEKDATYPEAWAFGMLPASGLYVRHARNLHFDHLTLAATRGEARPSVILDDVAGARLNGLASTPVRGSMPVVQLIECQDVQISNSAAPSGTAVFVGVEGSSSAGIVLSADDLSAARKPFVTSGDVPSGAVTINTGSTSPDSPQ